MGKDFFFVNFKFKQTDIDGENKMIFVVRLVFVKVMWLFRFGNIM